MCSKVGVALVLTGQKFVHVFFVILFYLFIPETLKEKKPREKKVESVSDLQNLVLSFESL